MAERTVVCDFCYRDFVPVGNNQFVCKDPICQRRRDGAKKRKSYHISERDNTERVIELSKLSEKELGEYANEHIYDTVDCIIRTMYN